MSPTDDDDSDYVYSIQMIVGVAVIALLLLVILICGVGCCVMWVRRKKTYSVSSVHYSNAKSKATFDGLCEYIYNMQYPVSQIVSLSGHDEISECNKSNGAGEFYTSIEGCATYENTMVWYKHMLYGVVVYMYNI